MDRIQIQYGINDVNELFSGKVTEFNNRISYYVHDVDSVTSIFGLVQNNVSGLMKNYRQGKKFDLCDSSLTSINERMKKFAVACYKVAYGMVLVFLFLMDV